MKRARSLLVGVFCLSFASSAPTLADGRIFLVPNDVNPNQLAWGEDFEITVDSTSSPSQWCFSAHIDVDPNEQVLGAQVTFPCVVPCSVSGHVEFFADDSGCFLGTDRNREDDFYEGCGCSAGWPIPWDCTEPVIFPPRLAVGLLGPPLPPITNMPHIGYGGFRVTPDCVGVAQIALPNEPDCAMLDEQALPIPFITNGVVFHVPAGRCCSEGGCSDGINAVACREAHGPNAVFVSNATCEEPCCFDHSDCDDGYACTFQQCSNTFCDVRSTMFGDVDGSGGPANIDDVLCAIGGFGNINDCPTADVWPNCTGNGIVTGDDLFAVIHAFGGFDPCGCGD